MKKIIVMSLFVVFALVSCVSTGSGLSDYFFLHGATMEEGPMGFILTSSGGNAMALRRVGPYTEEMLCEFSLQIVEDNDFQNGFLLLSGGQEGITIVAGVNIETREYVIKGTGVVEPIRVQIDFDKTQVFNFSILVNFEKGFIEMKTNEREIGTSLAPNMKQVDRVGYHADSTRTHFSEIKIVGN
jgi:hypothetical protein